MTERTTRKIGAWIPPDLYDDLKNMGYFGRQDQGEVSQTDTIIEGLKLLLENVSGVQSPQDVRQVGDTRGTSENTGELQVQVGQLGARNEELERFVETLRSELEQAHRDKEDLKEMYNKHVLQVQTLINQRAIEEAGNKKSWWKFWK